MTFGRQAGTDGEGNRVDVAMLGAGQRQMRNVSALAGAVSRDHAGRPNLSNLSHVHDLLLRCWPHSTSVVIEACPKGQRSNPPSKLLTDGWWWVHNNRTPESGWVLISVESSARSARSRLGRRRGASQQVGTADPPAVKRYELDKEATELLVAYFAEWFEFPPQAAPRVKTSAEVKDVQARVKERILRSLLQPGELEGGRMGRFSSTLLVRAVDEGTLDFGEVHGVLSSRGYL